MSGIKLISSRMSNQFRTCLVPSACDAYRDMAEYPCKTRLSLEIELDMRLMGM